MPLPASPLMVASAACVALLLAGAGGCSREPLGEDEAYALCARAVMQEGGVTQLRPTPALRTDPGRLSFQWTRETRTLVAPAATRSANCTFDIARQRVAGVQVRKRGSVLDMQGNRF